MVVYLGQYQSDLLLRWFDTDGTPLTGDVLVAPTDEGRPTSAGVVVDRGLGEAIVSWHASGHDGDGTGIVARRFDQTGAAAGNLVHVNQATEGNQANASPAISSAGKLLYAWDGPDGDQTGIFGQMFDPSGNRVGSEFRLNADTAGRQFSPALAYLPDGSFVAIWSQDFGGERGYDLMARMFRAPNDPVGGEFQVNVYTTGDQGGGPKEKAIAATASGEVVIVWRGEEQDGSSTGIIGRTYCVEGLAGRPCGDAACNSRDAPEAAIVASDALVILRAAVGSAVCAVCVCDTNASGGISATDALLVLQRAVGQPVALTCPICPSS